MMKSSFAQFFARLNPTERRFVVGVAVLFFIVINVVWVWPHFADWGATKVRMATASQRLVQFQEGANRIPAIQKEIEKYQKRGEVVPGAEQAVRFVRLIQNQAAQSGVSIVNMGGQRQSGTNAFFVEQNETLTLQSEEKQLVDFLYNLGAGNSLIRVRALSLQPDQPHQRLTTRVTLVASYEKKAPAPAGTSTPARRPAAAPTKPAVAPARPAAPPARPPAANLRARPPQSKPLTPNKK